MPSVQKFIQELTGSQREANPVKKRYNDLFKAEIGKFIASAAVVGLAAGIISRHPGHPLLAAAIYNVAIGSIHFILFVLSFFGPRVSPKTPTIARPSTWYLVILALSSAAWAAGFILLFVIRESGDKYEVFTLERRQRGAFREVGTGTLALLENITIACGCFGLVAFLFCLVQWGVVYMLCTTKYRKVEIRDGYRKVNKIEVQKKEEFPAA